MSKMITDINTCEQCPLFSSEMEYCCKHQEQYGRIIEDYEIMQSWCPLEDCPTPILDESEIDEVIFLQNMDIKKGCEYK